MPADAGTDGPHTASNLVPGISDRPAICMQMVVLPEPLAPRSQTMSPAERSKLTRSFKKGHVSSVRSTLSVKRGIVTGTVALDLVVQAHAASRASRGQTL